MSRMPRSYDDWKTRSDLDEWYMTHPEGEPEEPEEDEPAERIVEAVKPAPAKDVPQPDDYVPF